ncbi:MAG: hypothetical protein ABL932_14345 [Terricaulis sp.]
MADSLSTRYGFVLPEVGASSDTWGTKVNNDFSDLDAICGAITTAGSANAYTLTTGLSLAAYVAGQSFDIKASFSNSAAVTIAVDGLATKAITKNGTTALASGDIVSGNIYRISYDGTQFQLVGTTATGVYQPLDATLTALAALSWSSLTPVVQFTAADTVSLTNAPACTTMTGGTASNGITISSSAVTRNNVAGSMTIAAGTNAGNTLGFNTGGSTRLALSDSAATFTNNIVPVSNDGAALGTTALMWSDLFLASGGVINWNNGAFTLTQTAGALEASGTFRGRVALSSETGTPTSASANKKMVLTGGATINTGTADDFYLLDPGTSNRTITRGSGMTMYVNGTDSATATLAANQIGAVHYRSASVVVLTGAFS